MDELKEATVTDKQATINSGSNSGETGALNGGKETVAEVFIDKDCPMCQRFGGSLTQEGFAVTPREAARGSSIEVTLKDGSKLSGYFAILEISRQRGYLPNTLYQILKAPGISLIGKIGYRFVAHNRKFLSRFMARP